MISKYPLARFYFLSIANLVFQLLVVYVQNRKLGTKVMLRESLIVLMMLKPASDAVNVATHGTVLMENATIDLAAELTITKCSETIFEAIPSCVLQMYFLIGSDEISMSVISSVVCSASSIAYASATISLDYDSAPSKRKIAPYFYVSQTKQA